MNVLQLCTHLNIGGITSYVVNLAKGLKKRNHRVIVSSSGGNMINELKKSGIPHLRLDIKTKSELSPKIILALPKLLSLIRDNEVHLIHAHTRVTQVLACMASRLSGIPYIATCHGFFKLRLGRRIFKCWGDRTIAISEAVRRHLEDVFNVPYEKTDLVCNGVEIERFKKEFNEDEKGLLRKELNIKDGVIIGAIGRLSPVKGYRYLIEAFRHLLEEDEALQLLMVGNGPEKEMLKEMTKRLALEEYVIFAQPRLDTPEVLSIVDIFVSSSIQEGLGLSIVEALASGKPVVASDVGGVSSLIRDKKTGLLVRPKDSRALAQGISSLLKDPNLRNRLGQNGQRLIEREFTIDTMVDKIERVYKEAT